MAKYIISLDQGTTSSRAIAFNHEGFSVASVNKEFAQYYPQDGWVEHDANEIFSSQLAVLKELIIKQDIGTEEIAALGITNQRETVVLWDRLTGEPVHRAIVWQCRRTASLCEALKKKGYEQKIREKTGLLIDAYFSATKIQWILDAVAGLRERAERGEILAGTVDSWLIWKLSDGRLHATDVTNASRTMLFNIHSLEWDEDLLALFSIPRCILPEVRESSEIYCMTDEKVCGFSVPIASAIGDQQASLFGQACIAPGESKTTYGTGCFMLMHTGEKAVLSKNNLLTTIALGYKGKITYALEGSIFMGGAIIKWLRDELGLISSAPECDVLAELVPDSAGLVLVPAFTGLGTPYWDMYARGLLIGLTRGVNKAHICRAALEAIAFQVKDIIHCMEEDSASVLSCMKVDGGASVSEILMQFQADMLDTKVLRPKNTETTALGAAYLAGLAVGFWQDEEELFSTWQKDKSFEPKMQSEKREELYARWKKAVERSRSWLDV